MGDREFSTPRCVKTRSKDLAVFGGVPAFGEPLHVGRPEIGNRAHLLARINDILDRQWLTNDGRYVQEFERRTADLLGVGHCIAMCNATVALEILIRALGLRGEVIVPSFTFVATAHALQWQGITPVFGDVDPDTHLIDAARIEALITERTTGLLAVHLWGRPCDVETLSAIAYRHKLELVFDAAHAFSCSYRGRMIGNFGHAEVFSFHATKFVNTFEGGAVVTNDGELAARLRLMRNFGFASPDSVVRLGTNGKMDEVSAAMGLTGLDNLDDVVAVNYRCYKAYERALTGIPGIKLLTYTDTERANYRYIVLEVDQAQTRISRDHLTQILHAENVLARRYFYPGCHRSEPYSTLYPEARRFLPETEKLAERVLCLPTGSAVSADAIDAISHLMRLAIADGAELTALLSRESDEDVPVARRKAL